MSGRRQAVSALWVVLAFVGATRAQDGVSPELERCLRQLKGYDVAKRLRAAKEIARIGPAAAPMAARIVEVLGDQDGQVREQMLEAVIAIGPAVVPHLGPLLEDEKAKTRAADAAELLARFGRREYIEPHVAALVELLGEPRACREAARALAIYHADSLGELEKLCLERLHDDDRAVVAAMGTLLREASDAAIPPLIQTLASERADVRNAAAVALAGIGRRALPALKLALRDTNAHVVAAAAEAVGDYGSEAADVAPRLLELYRTHDRPDVRGASVRALARTGALAAKAIPSLIDDLGDDAMREASIAALSIYGEPAADLLLAQATTARRPGALRALAASSIPLTGAPNEGAAATRLMLVEALGLRGTLDPVGPFLRDEDFAVRWAAASLLLGTEEQSAAPVFVEGLGSSDVETRLAAVEALDTLRAGRDGLAKARRDPDPRVRAIAAVATWRFDGDAAAARAIVAPIVRDSGNTGAIEAAGRLGREGLPLIPALSARLEDREEASAVRVATVGALHGILAGRGLARRHGPRGLAKVKRKSDRVPIEKGLQWLARAHRPRAAGTPDSNGRWSCGEFGGFRGYDVGVTGLALQALLAAGNTPDSGPYHTNLADGLAFLAHGQADDGLLSAGPDLDHRCVEHAIATWAICEAYALTGEPGLGGVARRAVDHIVRAQLPAIAPGWGYNIEAFHNTHVTIWMVCALRFGKFSGIHVPADALEGGAKFINKMTEPTFGQVGYTYPGGAPTRLKGLADTFPPEQTQSLTAAGCWARYLLGKHDCNAAHRKGHERIHEIPPRWEKGYTDLYYWQFGALALTHGARRSGASRRWLAQLVDVLRAHQEQDGSWPPEGAWGSSGGRVYSTAMAVLALLAPYRYPARFLEKSAYLPSIKDGLSALARASKAADKDVAVAARKARAALGLAK